MVTFVPPRLVLRYEGPHETVEECVPDAPKEWRQAEQSLPGSVASVSHERVRKLLRVIDNLHYQLVRRSHYRTCRNADVARPPLQPSSRAGDSPVRSPPRQRCRGERGESSRQGEVRERAAGATPGIAPSGAMWRGPGGSEQFLRPPFDMMGQRPPLAGFRPPPFFTPGYGPPPPPFYPDLYSNGAGLSGSGFPIFPSWRGGAPGPRGEDTSHGRGTPPPPPPWT